MSVKSRLIRLLGGTEVVGDPDEFIEAGLVAFMVSEIVVAKLDDADIPAHAVPERSMGASGLAQRVPKARIFVRRRDINAAMPIINEVSIGW